MRLLAALSLAFLISNLLIPAPVARADGIIIVTTAADTLADDGQRSPGHKCHGLPSDAPSRGLPSVRRA